MIIADIEAIPLRIPFKAGTKSDASAWGDSNLPAADSSDRADEETIGDQQ